MAIWMTIRRALGVALLGCCCAAHAQSGWTLVWSDEFNGAAGSVPDGGKWGYDLGNGGGFGNNELEYYTNATDNVAMDGAGHLAITARVSTSSALQCWYGTCKYTSGRILTKDKFTQAYGRMEARIKIPRGQGMWPAFWMLGANIDQPGSGWPTCGEIDVMENVGKTPSTVYGTIHGPGYSGANGISSSYTLASGAFADDYHLFSVEWSPKQVRFLVDNNVYRTLTPADLPRGTTWVYDHPFFLLLNLAVGGGWPGDPDASTVFPQQMLVDYVRVYQPAPDGGAPLDRAIWTGTASSSDGADLPYHMFDGSGATRWTTGAPQVPGQWLRVDMGAPHTINQITIDAGAGSNDYPRGYQVYVSNDGVNWGSPVATGNGTSALISVPFPEQNARYIQVVQTSNNASWWWSVAELNVYNKSLGNAGWVATASSSNGSDVPANMLDSVSATRWSSGHAQTPGDRFQVDMGAPRNFNLLLVDAGASVTDYVRAYQVFVSADGVNWGSAIASGVGSGAAVSVPLSNQSARYVQVRETGSDPTAWWSVAEFNAYQRLDRSGWSASASSSNGGDVAANVLDGQGSRWTTGQMQAPGQWLVVDMAASRTFNGLLLDAGGSSTDYARGYQVYVSNDGVNWGNAVATGSGTTALINSTFPSQKARYIKLVQTGSASNSWWSVAELNVYNK